MTQISTTEQIRKSFLNNHIQSWYREEHHVPMDNEAFPHTFNASWLENQIKEIISKWVKPINDKLFCIQPCFRRFYIENIDRNGYSIFFQMCWKAYFTPNLESELPGYFQKHLDWFVKDLWIDSSKLWFTIFWWWKIASIWDTEMPEDTRSMQMLLDLWISKDRIISIKNSEEKWEIDNFLVRFEREREKYSWYGIDVYYDLWESQQLWDNDTLPGNIKWWRFMEISTTWICDYWRDSGYGEAVKLIDSPMPVIVTGTSLERLAFILQWANSVFELTSYKKLNFIIQKYWFSPETTKRFVALLVPLYYIISEWNLPKGWSRSKQRELRVIFRDLFDSFDSFDSFEWLLEILKSNNKYTSNRKELFRELSFKEKSFVFRTYEEILKVFGSTYDTLKGHHKSIIDIVSDEKAVYLEKKYQEMIA